MCFASAFPVPMFSHIRYMNIMYVLCVVIKVLYNDHGGIITIVS